MSRQRDDHPEELVGRLVDSRGRLGGRVDGLGDIARSALLDAIAQFGPDRGVPFVRFAVPRILGELRRHAGSARDAEGGRAAVARLAATTEALTATLGRSPSIPEIARAMDIDTEGVIELLEAARRLGPADAAPGARAEPARERQIMHLRFGEELPQREIAARVGMSQIDVLVVLQEALQRPASPPPPAGP